MANHCIIIINTFTDEEINCDILLKGESAEFIEKVGKYQVDDILYVYGFSNGDIFVSTNTKDNILLINKIDPEDIQFIINLRKGLLTEEDKRRKIVQVMNMIGGGQIPETYAHEFFDYIKNLDFNLEESQELINQLKQKANFDGGAGGAGGAGGERRIRRIRPRRQYEPGWTDSKSMCWVDFIMEIVGIIPIAGFFGDMGSIVPTVLRRKWFMVILDLADIIPGLGIITGIINAILTFWDCITM